MRAVIVFSSGLLAVGLLRAERLSSSCVAGSLGCVVGVALSLAHSCVWVWPRLRLTAVVVVVQLHVWDAPLLAMGTIKRRVGRPHSRHFLTNSTPVDLLALQQ